MTTEGSQHSAEPPRSGTDRDTGSGRDIEFLNLNSQPPVYRIWIADYRDWLPNHWYDVPPARLAVALQPAEEGCLAAEQARAFLKGFNRRMLAEAKPLWAVALKVSVLFAGDAQSGQNIHGHQFAIGPDGWK